LIEALMGVAQYAHVVDGKSQLIDVPPQKCGQAAR
jgi:hypothetical protein